MQIYQNRFNRIMVHPGKKPAEPFIRGSGVPVAAILSYLGSGKGVDDILEEWPELEREDIYQALSYAAWQMEDCSL